MIEYNDLDAHDELISYDPPGVIPLEFNTYDAVIAYDDVVEFEDVIVCDELKDDDAQDTFIL